MPFAVPLAFAVALCDLIPMVGATRLFPAAHRARAGRIADVMVDKVGAYMIGNLLISLAAGLASFAVRWPSPSRPASRSSSPNGCRHATPPIPMPMPALTTTPLLTPTLPSTPMTPT